jgi:hypothetical protein
MHEGIWNGHTFPQEPQLFGSFVGLTHVGGQKMSPGGQSVVDVVLAEVVDVVVEAVWHTPVARSQASPEQQTVAAEHDWPVGVQQPQPALFGSGSQRSNCTAH